MAVIGVDTLTSISRRYILPEIVDNIYRSNPLFYRLNASNRKITGGTQIEVPLMYKRFAAGGPYQGADVLTIAPSDTVRNAVFTWKQQYVPVVFDGLTLIKADTPEAIANLMRLQAQQAEEEMCENLGTGIHSDGTTDPKQIAGLQLAVDSAGVYGGLDRSTYTWWGSYKDSTTTIMSLSGLQAAHGTATEGGRHPTLIVGQQAAYNRYWALGSGAVIQDIGPAGSDMQLAAAGFKNMLFNGVPWVVDSHTVNSSTIFMLNEDYIFLVVTPRADFALEDFQTPVNQDAAVSKLLWAGELVCTNPGRQAKLTAIAA
jgi:hypothetical protein